MANNFDLRGLQNVIRRVAETPKKAEQAMQRSRSTVARRVKPFARRDIQAEYNLRAARIDQGLAVSQTQDTIVLTGAKRGVGEIEFAGRHSRRQKGASSQVRKDKGRSIDPGSFIATLHGGNRQMVIRDTKKRLPISVLYGPSIAQMLRRPGRAERIADFAQTVLSAEIARLLR